MSGADPKRMVLKRLLVVALAVALLAAWFAFDLGSHFTLESLQASRDRFDALYKDNRLLFVAGYFLLYVLTAALSLPAATIITLAGGAIFGLWLGTLVVSFASTIGATLACAASRFVLRDWVRSRLGARVAALNRGVEREGAFYLFTMRLIPAFPFFAINLGMGLTSMRLTTFYWVSQVGMLPGTMVYVFAGSELGELTSLSDVFSLDLLLSFALLGVFPLAAKKLLGWYKKRRNA